MNKTILEDKTRYLFNSFHPDPIKYGDVNLIQVGRRFLEPSAVVNAHNHLDWFELTLTTAGQGRVITNGEDCKVSATDIYLSFPFETHEIKADLKDKMEYDFFAFSCENTELKEMFDLITVQHRQPQNRVFRDEKISALIRRAISEISVKKPFQEQILTAIFKQILIYIVRDFNDLKQDASDVSNAEILCLQIMTYIDTHIYSMENLAELSEVFNYNYSYLSTLFKNTTNKTLLEYLRDRKLQTAKVLVLEKNKKIGEIADLLNYSSTFAFSKAFKAKYGVSPAKLR